MLAPATKIALPSCFTSFISVLNSNLRWDHRRNHPTVPLTGVTTPAVLKVAATSDGF